MNIQEIKAYKTSIDSMYNLYDSLYHSLTDTAAALFVEMKLGEGIGEGVYKLKGQNGDSMVGGFSVRPFVKGDTICRIIFSGGKMDAYVTKAFYYRSNNLVFTEMTVRRWRDKNPVPYKVEEYYWRGKRIGTKKTNVFPLVKDKSLIPKSLFKDGMAYLGLYGDSPGASRR